MKVRRTGSGFGIALVAAYLLFLQAAISGFISGASAAPLSLDAFGNPLCITSTDVGSPAEGGGDHQSPECCLSACAMFAPVLASGEVPKAPTVLHADTATIVPLPAPTLAQRSRGEPGNPRAPPRTA